MDHASIGPVGANGVDRIDHQQFSWRDLFFSHKERQISRLEFHLCPLKTLSQDNACCREIFGKDGYDGT